MYYIKFKCPEGRSHLQLITPDNVVCICPECGREVPVDLAKESEEAALNLLVDEVYCEDCRLKAFRQVQARKLDATLQKLCSTVIKDIHDGLVMDDQPVYNADARNHFEEIVFECLDLLDSIEVITPNKVTAEKNEPCEEENDG